MLSRPDVQEAYPWVLLRRDDAAVLYNRASLAVLACGAGGAGQDIGALTATIELPAAQEPAASAVARAVSRAFQPILSGSPSRLGRLTINIANACNLWCSYCYADHGQYHAPSSLMPPEMAVNIVERCLTFYPLIRSLQFFGGEPLLNPDAIEAVCEHLTQRFGQRRPKLVATTNGTILDDRIADLLAKYEIGLTISIDGPREIHDRLRPTRSMRSSHDLVTRNVAAFRKLGIEVDVECTYTSAHVRSGVSVIDLMGYFHDELDIGVPHIAWAYLPKPREVGTDELSSNVFRGAVDAQMREHVPAETLEREFRAAAALSVRNILRGEGPALSFVVGIAGQLASRTRTRNYCPAFNTRLSISAQGDAFPCFMFYGDPRMNMGNIFAADFPGPRAREIWGRYAAEFGALPTGDDDWCSALVSGCVAGDYLATSGFSERPYRAVNRAMIEEVLLGLSRVANVQPA